MYFLSQGTQSCSPTERALQLNPKDGFNSFIVPVRFVKIIFNSVHKDDI